MPRKAKEPTMTTMTHMQIRLVVGALAVLSWSAVGCGEAYEDEATREAALSGEVAADGDDPVYQRILHASMQLRIPADQPPTVNRYQPGSLVAPPGHPVPGSPYAEEEVHQAAEAEEEEAQVGAIETAEGDEIARAGLERYHPALQHRFQVPDLAGSLDRPAPGPRPNGY
jgi:hypothetical protein